MTVNDSKRYNLLLCNGEMTGADLASALAGKAATIVCADGGANSARDLGVMPDIIIGDMDSITESTERHYRKTAARFIHQTGQDNTDFEKALLYLKERRAERESGAPGPWTDGWKDRQLVILGVTGKLLDHTLGNFSILLRYVRDFRMTLFDTHYRIDVLDTPSAFLSRPGDRISIIPLLPSTGVRIDGLKYDLMNRHLAPGEVEGTCNEALGELFRIEIDSGVLLVFRELHPALWDIDVDNSL